MAGRYDSETLGEYLAVVGLVLCPGTIEHSTAQVGVVPLLGEKRCTQTNAGCGSSSRIPSQGGLLAGQVSSFLYHTYRLACGHVWRVVTQLLVLLPAQAFSNDVRKAISSMNEPAAAALLVPSTGGAEGTARPWRRRVARWVAVLKVSKVGSRCSQQPADGGVHRCTGTDVPVSAATVQDMGAQLTCPLVVRREAASAQPVTAVHLVR